MVDDVSVATFAQLGSSFFAAARARLAHSRDDAWQHPVLHPAMTSCRSFGASGKLCVDVSAFIVTKASLRTAGIR